MGKISTVTAGVTDYFKGVMSEMRHIVWPSRAEVIQHTAVVVVFSVVIALFLAGLDILFRQGVDALLNIK